MLDVGDLDHLRLGGRLDPDRVRAQGADDALGDDPLLTAVLVAAQQLLAEVVVDRRVGAAPDRAGQGHARDARPRAAHEQLRAGAEEGRLGRAAAEAEAGGELLAHGAEEGGRVVGRGRADDHLAGEDDLAHLPRPDPLGRGGDHRFEVAGRADAADRGLRGRVRVEHRQPLALAQPRQPGLQRRAPCRGVLAGADHGVDGQVRGSVAAADRDLRQGKHRRRQRRPRRRAGALGVEGESPGPDGPGARRGGRRAPSTSASRPAPRHSRATSAKRASPLEVASWATPSAARAKPRSGCSQQNQRSDASREEKATAQGSAISTGTVTLTRVRRSRPDARPIRSRRLVRSVSVAAASNRDLTRADHLDQAVGADHLLEGLDLVGRAGDLDRHRPP